MDITSWHTLTTEQVLQSLNATVDRGLSNEEVEQKRKKYGPNELIEIGRRSPLQIIWEQFSSAMIVLLVVAAIISLFLHEYIDAAAIFAIIFLNAALGFFQDYRAEQALAALKKFAVPTVKVRRNGALREIAAKELVPGDVVTLEAGNFVPADGRLLESLNLRIQEAALTGESEPVEKETGKINSGNLPIGDRYNMAYMGTLVSYGHGVAVVTETGMNTELGKVASSLQTVEREPTPLQDRLAQLGRTLAIVSLAIVALVFVLERVLKINFRSVQVVLT